jgi:hypothetical protein
MNVRELSGFEPLAVVANGLDLMGGWWCERGYIDGGMMEESGGLRWCVKGESEGLGCGW